MVTDVKRVSGNYNIQASNGNITLASPATIVTGNLIVYGTQTSVDSVNLVVTGTVVILNQGDPGPTTGTGITQLTPGFPAQTAGFMIARGVNNSTTAGAFLLYDDSVTTIAQNRNTTSTVTGMWRTSGQHYHPTNQYGGVIEVQAIRTPNQAFLNLLGAENPHAVLTVKGTTNYASNVIDGDDIPNKSYVDSQLSLGTTVTQKLQVGNTYIELLDNSVSTNSQYFSSTNQILAVVGGGLALTLTDAAVQFQDLTIINNVISITNAGTQTNTNIELSPSGQGIVQMDSGFSMLQTLPINTVTNFTGIYSTSTIGGGGTGVFFVNSAKTDELVSRKQAIVYGIIF